MSMNFELIKVKSGTTDIVKCMLTKIKRKSENQLRT